MAGCSHLLRSRQNGTGKASGTHTCTLFHHRHPAGLPSAFSVRETTNRVGSCSGAGQGGQTRLGLPQPLTFPDGIVRWMDIEGGVCSGLRFPITLRKALLRPQQIVEIERLHCTDTFTSGQASSSTLASTKTVQTAITSIVSPEYPPEYPTGISELCIETDAKPIRRIQRREGWHNRHPAARLRDAFYATAGELGF